MYKERKEKLGILNYLVYIFILLLILIIVIVIIAKSSKKKVKEKPKEMVLYSEEAILDLESKHSESFAASMASFKFAAIDYYKDKLGSARVDMVLTLKDFYDKHIIEELKINDTKCDSDNSKVEVTKKSGEYLMDITLVCGEDKDTIKTYIGKYTYCKNSDICEKKIEKKSKKNENPTTVEPSTVEPSTVNPTTVEPEPTPEPTPEPAPSNTKSKYTFYEYTLTPSNQIGKYSEWSNWGKDVIESSLFVEVDTKEETETKTEGCTETREESYISGYNTETYIAGYVTKKYQIGTHKVQIGTRQVKRGGKVVNEPIYEEQPLYQTKEEPVYKTKQTPIYSTRQVTVDNCTSSTKYYRSRKFTYNQGINYIKYSISDNDSTLLNNGYTKTGNTKEF